MGWPFRRFQNMLAQARSLRLHILALFTLFSLPLQQICSPPPLSLCEEEERLGDQRVRVTNLSVEPAHPATGQIVRFILDLDVPKTESSGVSADISISFMSEQGFKIFQLHSGHVGQNLSLKPGNNRIVAEPEYLPLTPGRYHINLWVGSGKFIYDWIPEALTLDVEPGSFDQGVLIDNRGYPVVVNAHWQKT